MRKTFRIVLFGTILLAFATAGAEASSVLAVAERPNFVFVMTDDLDERSMRDLAGIRQVMGSNGATFENAYYSYPCAAPAGPPF